jgi:hypothetical protein
VYFSTNEHPGCVQSESVSSAFSLTPQAFQYFEKLVELNQQVVKATLAGKALSYHRQIVAKAAAQAIATARQNRPTAAPV